MGVPCTGRDGCLQVGQVRADLDNIEQCDLGTPEEVRSNYQRTGEGCLRDAEIQQILSDAGA